MTPKRAAETTMHVDGIRPSRGACADERADERVGGLDVRRLMCDSGILPQNLFDTSRCSTHAVPTRKKKGRR